MSDMKEHGRTATKLIGEEIARLTQMARQIKADEQDKPCDDRKGGAVVPDKPLPYGTEETQAAFWRATSKVWYDRWTRIHKERTELWQHWHNRYVELKRFKLANFSTQDILSELERRSVVQPTQAQEDDDGE